jgi:threonyl-tRNA synthetase
MERFCGVLIEHFAGNFPTWLAPEQVRILPMNDDLIEQAEKHMDQLKQKGIRTSIDSLSGKLGAKIRKAENDKIPHMLIIGKKEAEEGKVSVRSRANPKLDGSCLLDQFSAAVTSEIKNKDLPAKRQT